MIFRKRCSGSYCPPSETILTVVPLLIANDKLRSMPKYVMPSTMTNITRPFAGSKQFIDFDFFSPAFGLHPHSL